MTTPAVHLRHLTPDEVDYPRAGLVVKFDGFQGHPWELTVTEAGAACDCGKGIWCPLNPQRRL